MARLKLDGSQEERGRMCPSAQESTLPMRRTPRADGRGHGHRQHQPAASAGGLPRPPQSRAPCSRLLVSRHGFFLALGSGGGGAVASPLRSSGLVLAAASTGLHTCCVLPQHGAGTMDHGPEYYDELSAAQLEAGQPGGRSWRLGQQPRKNEIEQETFHEYPYL